MRGLAALTCLAVMFATSAADVASAQQPAANGCSTEQKPGAAQTLRCRDGLIIVAEDGAKFTLQGQGRQVDGVDVQSKAVLIDAPKQKGKGRFQVITPQAIAAVRGTKWAVDAEGAKTSVFVVNGSVRVARPRGRGSVVLGAGDGVDVEPTGELIVKRWPAPRVSALMARLGQ